MLAGLVFGLLLVNEVQTPGLDFAVNESACKAGHYLLGFLVALGLAYEIVTSMSAFAIVKAEKLLFFTYRSPRSGARKP